MSSKLTHEEFIKRVRPEDRDLNVRGIYVNAQTSIEVECKFGHVWYPRAGNLMANHYGCPYCSGKKLLIGETDLWTTRPDIASMLKNKDDGYRYTKGSNKKVDFVCNDCGAINNKSIDMVCRYGFSCRACSDGISYPNKFGRAVLNQLVGDDFECEYQPEWAKPYFYDNYFEADGNGYIVEMDGMFHYEESQYANYSLSHQKNIDAIKDELALCHGIQVIRIDCRKSDCNYIKHSILNSKLCNIFDLSQIDWKLCDIKAQKNLMKEVCHLYNNGTHDLNDIKNILHISMWSTQKYIKIGANSGLCDYTVEKGRRLGWDKTMTAINVISGNNVIHHFDGIRLCAREMEKIYNKPFNSPNIIKSCKTHKPYKGFNFEYA